MVEETLVNDGNQQKRLLSPRELKMNTVSKRNKTHKIMKSWEHCDWNFFFFNVVIRAIRKDSLKYLLLHLFTCSVLVWACDQNHLKLSNFLLLTWQRQRAHSFLLLFVLPYSWLLTPRGSQHSLVLATSFLIIVFKDTSCFISYIR